MIEIPTLNCVANRTTGNLFFYRNVTDRLQIIRVEQTLDQWLEKVVFPGEQLLFYSMPEAFFDIYHSTKTGLTLVHRVPCSQLQVLESGI